MRKIPFLILLNTLLTLSSSAHALELLVVKNYRDAQSSEIWKKTKADEVPQHLLSEVTVTDPSNAYSSLFPKAFLQDSLFAVCTKNCEEQDIFSLRNGNVSAQELLNWDVIEQGTVYYWLKKYFHFLDKDLNYRPDQFLKVVTNKDLRIQGQQLKNNAFFNPREVSLTFLPASKNLMFKLLSGKINRSGYDPSVIAHEASHYLFHHLLQNNVNDEIGGVNEGFADYVANIFLNNPKVGNVMLQGRSIRDSSSLIDASKRPKVYIPKLEVHELGERVAFALWKTRELATNFTEMDRMVLDAVIALGKNPYATAHDFSLEMQNRLDGFIPSENLTQALKVWETTFPPVPKLTNLGFLNTAELRSPIIAIKMRQEVPANVAKEAGVNPIEEHQVSLYHMIKLDERYLALSLKTSSGQRPYWVTVDVMRDTVEGVYQDKRLMTSKEELSDAKVAATEATKFPGVYKDFKQRSELFAGLAQGKGPLMTGLKVTDKSISEKSFIFNNKEVTGSVIKLNLKRKLIAGTLLGIADIDALDLYLLPLKIEGLPQVEGLTVIGYKLLLRDGTAAELLLESHKI
jgi:hypothetical protein